MVGRSVASVRGNSRLSSGTGVLLCGGVDSLGGRRGVVGGTSNGVGGCSLSVVTVVVLVDEESAGALSLSFGEDTAVNASERSGCVSAGMSLVS